MAICTRNRGASIVDTLKSVMACTPADFEVIVIDQSTNDDTQNAIMAGSPDARLRYMRTPTKGLSRARNIAIAAAANDIVVFTDDDCIVPPDYMTVFASIFAANPRVAVAYCNVKPFPHDPTQGMIPIYVRTGDALLTRLVDRCVARGIGAGMAVRRSMLNEMGGFDEMQGPGARFGTADDMEIAQRALMLGFHVYETDKVAVLHNGYRSWKEYRTKMSHTDWYAIGSCFAKGLKSGHLSMLVVMSYEFWVRLIRPLVYDLVHLKRPYGLLRPFYLIHGIVAGLLTPVDRKHILFR